MGMTKKDFIGLADVLMRQYDVYDSQHTIRVLDLADILKACYPNFHRERWLNYIEGKCGPNGGKIRTQHATEPEVSNESTQQNQSSS